MSACVSPIETTVPLTASPLATLRIVASGVFAAPASCSASACANAGEAPSSSVSAGGTEGAEEDSEDGGGSFMAGACMEALPGGGRSRVRESSRTGPGTPIPPGRTRVGRRDARPPDAMLGRMADFRRYLPRIDSPAYYILLGVVAIFILGPLGGITAAYMNFSLGFFVGGQVLAGILGSVVTY